MADKNVKDRKPGEPLSRRSFLYSAFGGAFAAVLGWLAGFLPGKFSPPIEEEDAEKRLTLLEEQVAELAEECPADNCGFEDLATLEGEYGQRVIFNKREVSIINPYGVLLNLVSTQGHVGIRFYKDFYFENEQETHPWHFGYIEGTAGYEGLAILRDWDFTAALWDADGKLTVGKLQSHPPANEPARARFDVRGTLDELHCLVEANPVQTANIFQVRGADGTNYLAVDGEGNLHVGAATLPRGLILHDTADGSAYAVHVTNGQLVVEAV